MIRTNRWFSSCPYLEETEDDGTWVYLYYMWGQRDSPLLIQNGQDGSDPYECPKNWVLV